MTLLAIIMPSLGVIAAAFFLWGRGFHWTDLGLLLTMYILTGLGITVGFHRLFTHRSFETHRTVQLILGVLGSMAVQGPLLRWVAFHRRHHQHSDHDGDPHSPHEQVQGFIGVLRGLWRAHIGWFFESDPPGLDDYVKNLRRSGLQRAVSALFPIWVIAGLLIPTVLGGLLSRSWMGVFSGFLWGGLVRIFLLQHVTWGINSVCHLWGRRPYRTDDESRNNAVFGVLGLGAGWHNNHHAFPNSARHGLRWWQIDVSYWVIRAMSLLGLAWNLKLPSKQAQEKMRDGS